MLMRSVALIALLLALAPPPAAAQRRPRARNESSRLEGATAVKRHFDAYQKKVKAPNGVTIDLTPVLRRIAEGRSLAQDGFPPHAGDGSVFLNLTDRQAGRPPLPEQPRGYYVEYVVPPNDRARWPGPQRLIVGRRGEAYYSPDHYAASSIVVLHRHLK